MSFYLKKLMPAFMLMMAMLAAGGAAFAAPALLEPNDLEACVSYKTTFKWSPAANAVYYRLQVSDTVSFEDNRLLLDSGNIAAVTAVAVTKPDSRLFWRVVAYYSYGAKDTSSSRSFVTKKISPEGITPLNGSNCNLLPAKFTWTAGPWSFYEIQISEVPTFDTLMVLSEINLDTNAYGTIMPKHSQKYYWRVRGLLNGCYSDWMTTHSFTTGPAAPALLYPANPAKGGDIFTARPFVTELKWAKIDSTVHYVIQVSNNAAFDTPAEFTVDTTVLSYNFGQEFNKSFYWRAKAIFNTCETEWSPTSKLSTPYDAPAMLTPEMNASCVPLKPYLDWTNVDGATAYRVQASTSETFADTLLAYNKADITVSAVTAELPDAVTTYYWRVRGEDATNSGMWMTPGVFSTTINPPFITNPVPGSTGNYPDVTFRWDSIGTDAVYSLQVSDRNSFDTTLVNIDTLKTNTFSFKADDYNKVYYWRLAAVRNGCASGWGMTVSFKTSVPPPVAVSPADSAVRVFVSTELTWNAAAGAANYDIDLSKDASFTNLLRFERKVQNTKVIFQNLPEETKLYWRLRSNNAEGTSPWSKTYVFTTGREIPGLPVHISPANNSTALPTTVDLLWEKNPKAEQYILQVALDNFFESMLVDSTLDTNGFRLEGLANNKSYYWRIRALNNTGMSQWSTGWTFRTISLPPTGTVLPTYPPQNAKEISLNVSFSWVPIPDIAGYEMQLATSNDFSAASMIYESRNIWVPGKYYAGLKPDMTYFWRVRGWNDGGNSPWSDIIKFNTITSGSVHEQANSEIATMIVPQPVSGTATISFDMKNAGTATVKIYDMSGKVVCVPFSGVLEAGRADVKWNTAQFESGVYIYYIELNGYTETGRISVAR